MIAVLVLAQRFLPDEGAPANTTVAPAAAGQVEAAYRARQSGIMMDVAGVVAKVLPDDLKGDRHQRFILALPSGHTVLVAHNIDLAPRIHALTEGDDIRLRGQYEWNDKGGVLHWTHHAPRKDHAEGWIEHAGRRYQ